MQSMHGEGAERGPGIAAGRGAVMEAPCSAGCRRPPPRRRKSVGPLAELMEALDTHTAGSAVADLVGPCHRLH